MCEFDELYEAGSDQEDGGINDELLIALVQANPLLYNKADKNFKNVEMKRDKWTAISVGCGASSGPAAERRWAALRNLLGRKMREMKEKGPSGAAGGKKPTVWPLLGPMSFLLPFIDNRRKRGSSVTQAGSSRSNTQSPSLTQAGSSRSNTQSPSLTQAGSSRSNTQSPSVTQAVSRSNTQSPAFPLSPGGVSCEETASSTHLWDTLSSIISPSTETDQDISSAENSTCSEPNSKRDEKKGRKSEVPPPDPFATKKKQENGSNRSGDARVIKIHGTSGQSPCCPRCR